MRFAQKPAVRRWPAHVIEGFEGECPMSGRTMRDFIRRLQITPNRRPHRRVMPWLALAAFAAMALTVAPAQAQFIPCLPMGQPLLKIPEFVSSNGVLKATVLLQSVQQRLTFRQPSNTIPGAAGTSILCSPQYVRTYTGVGALPALPPTPAGQYPDPVPGPVLRARVGDVVNLTFLNQIDPNNFGDSIDRAENGVGNGCDSSTNGYPDAGGDTFPDCFHGSSTGNIHFHGTHTNPNTTGDNVFIELRPSPRVNGRPTITGTTFKKQFDQFFAECNKRLSADALLEWPRSWEEEPLGPPTKAGTYTNLQKRFLQVYDKDKPQPQKLWPVDEKQLLEGAWPQYYIGAYPYCYRLPAYAGSTWPPAPPAAHAAMKMGPLSMDMTRPLQMGQSPGTHWYHAHKHGSTAINVSNGMTGVFIIEGQYDDDLDAFYGKGWARKQPVMVINQLGVTPNLEVRKAGRTDKGANFSLNGRMQPVVTMQPGEVQLWRIANTSSRAGAFFVGPPAGVEWKQIAQDGVQYADANYQKNHNSPFLLAAGNRADILIKAPATAGTYAIQVKNEVDPSDLTATPPAIAVTLVSITVAGAPATGPQSQFIPHAPALPPFLTDITPNEVSGTKTITFASTPPGGGKYAVHTIDGMKFNGDVGAAVLLNNVEEWTIVNETYGPLISHPFHIHINPFQVVEVFAPNQTISDGSGGQIPKYVFYAATAPTLKPGQCAVNVNDKSTWKPCGPPAAGPFIWWDVFPIPSGAAGTVDNVAYKIPGHFKMRSRFVDYPGLFVIHCHILAHEDRGMMTIVDVVPYKTALSHQ
jgi:FtsP/CotA-like multicopper oxidase with cupredoxin domain